MARSKPLTARAKHIVSSAPPPFRPVQLAKLVDAVPAGNSWLHEMKYDGYRTLVAVGGGEARAYTRSGLDWSEKFGGIVEAAAGLGVDSALIDGEAVVLDADEARYLASKIRAEILPPPVGSLLFYSRRRPSSP